MEISLFIFYLLLLSYFITIIPFFKTSGIRLLHIVTLFAVKVLAGVGYGLFYTLPKYSQGADTWRFYRFSLQETGWLKRDPVAFITDLFVHRYNSSGNLFTGENSYWNDLKSNVLIKIMAVINVFTFNSYYVNIILFNFLFMFGLVALFKIFITVFPEKKIFLIACIFLLPSTLFWCSGIHKDGLILSATGLIIYDFSRIIGKGITVKRLVRVAILLALIFALRNYVVLCLIPALFAWGLSERWPEKKIAIFFLTYVVGCITFFVTPAIYPAINFPLFLAEKQNEFLQLQGNSQITSKALHPSPVGFLSYLPTALDVAFLRPHLTEIKNLSYIPAAAEVLLLIVIILSFLFVNSKAKLPPPVLFFLFFSISILLICGFTITFSGAIVRYRSLALPLLITPLVCLIPLSWLEELIKTKLLKRRSTFKQ